MRRFSIAIMCAGMLVGCGEGSSANNDNARTNNVVPNSDPHVHCACDNGGFNINQESNNSSTPSCEPGTERCECLDGLCDEGLICVDPEDKPALNGTCGLKNACNDPEVASEPCGVNCAFDPGFIDCGLVCDNILENCQFGGACPFDDWMRLVCGTDDGIIPRLDRDGCIDECETGKELSCHNVGFGCWATAGPDCEAVPQCIWEKR